MLLKDSLSGELRQVAPKTVSIYACGITPYSSAHVGHARTYVVFDLLKRVLDSQGHETTLVRNVTDIDDKIIAAAKKEGVSWDALAERYAAENRALMLETGLPVPMEPYASKYLEEIFDLVQALILKGFAYVAPTGDVLYRVSMFKGQLLMPHKDGALLSEQGVARVNGDGKEDLRDFVLWKQTPATEPGFDSPWGWGRPGWHIECSAMISKIFGGSVTIHGGGVDLKFPHHQAEIMQSEPIFGRPLADIWMHNGSVTSDGQKMSKSLGNFVTWRKALDTAEALVPGLGPELLRMALLQAHWQKPLDWSDKLLHTTKADLLQLTRGLDTLKPDDGKELRWELNANLNTPGAFVWLRAQHKAKRLKVVAGGLEFLGVSTARWAAFKDAPAVSALTPAQIQDLEARRVQARADKNWPLADSLRAQLQAHGVEVQDPTVK